MTGKDFLRALANGRTDMVQVLLDILRMVEAHPELKDRLPAELREQAE